MKRIEPLDSVTRPAVSTAEAAFYLNRKPQTLRAWASKGIGAMKPANVGGRLLWSTGTIRHLLLIGSLDGRS